MHERSAKPACVGSVMQAGAPVSQLLLLAGGWHCATSSCNLYLMQVKIDHLINSMTLITCDDIVVVQARKNLEYVRGTSNVDKEFAALTEAADLAKQVKHPWVNIFSRSDPPLSFDSQCFAFRWFLSAAGAARICQLGLQGCLK